MLDQSCAVVGRDLSPNSFFSSSANRVEGLWPFRHKFNASRNPAWDSLSLKDPLRSDSFPKGSRSGGIFGDGIADECVVILEGPLVRHCCSASRKLFCDATSSNVPSMRLECEETMGSKILPTGRLEGRRNESYSVPEVSPRRGVGTRQVAMTKSAVQGRVYDDDDAESTGASRGRFPVS